MSPSLSNINIRAINFNHYCLLFKTLHIESPLLLDSTTTFFHRPQVHDD